jgi:hypothetical protein
MHGNTRGSRTGYVADARERVLIALVPQAQLELRIPLIASSVCRSSDELLPPERSAASRPYTVQYPIVHSLTVGLRM